MHHPMKNPDFFTILICQYVVTFVISVELTTLQSWKSHKKYNAVHVSFKPGLNIIDMIFPF